MWLRLILLLNDSKKFDNEYWNAQNKTENRRKQQHKLTPTAQQAIFGFYYMQEVFSIVRAQNKRIYSQFCFCRVHCATFEFLLLFVSTIF